MISSSFDREAMRCGDVSVRPCWLDARSCIDVVAYTGEAIVSPPPSVKLNAAWLMLVFGDCSPTRVLSLATGSPLCIDLLGTETLADDDRDGTPHGSLNAIRGPRVRRRVWLRNARGDRLGYAVSWWNESDLHACLPDERMPIGGALNSVRKESFRELVLIVRASGGHAELSAAFDCADSPLWARWYVLYSEGRAMCLVYECFSPKLLEWLGPCDL